MNKHVKYLIVFSLILHVVFVKGSSNPAADDGKWYYVKSQRWNTGATTPGPWWTMGTSTVTPAALTKSNNQKFTLISLAGGKVGIQAYGTNGTDGLKLSADGSAGTWNASGAATGWTLTSNVVNTIQGYAFYGENQGIHQGSGGWSWRVATGYYSLADNSSFFFYEVAVNLDLNLAIDDAKTFKASAIAGTNPGEYPQIAFDNLNTAISTAESAMHITDQTTLNNAVIALNTALQTFKDAKIPPVTSSTASSPVWYLIKSVGRVLGGTTYTSGFGTQIKCTTTPIPADGTGIGNAAPGLKYLFRFEKQSDGSYKIINALFPMGETLQTASGGSNSQPVNYGTSNESKWNFNKLVGGTPTVQFNIVSTGVGTIWHHDGSNNVVSWAGGVGSASAWYFEQYTGSVTSLYTTALSEVITLSNSIYNNTRTGTTFSQFPAAARTAFQTAISDAQSALDNIGSKTGDEIMAAITALTTATTTYKNSIITDKTTLVATNTDKHRWFTIRSSSTHSYIAGKIISSTGRVLTNKFTFENPGTPVTDAQLFRFEISGNDIIIINKANGYYMAANGAISTSSASFALNQLTDGYSFNIKPASADAIHAQESGSVIVNWSGDAGSASAWVFDY